MLFLKKIKSYAITFYLFLNQNNWFSKKFKIKGNLKVNHLDKVIIISIILNFNNSNISINLKFDFTKNLKNQLS